MPSSVYTSRAKAGHLTLITRRHGLVSVIILSGALPSRATSLSARTTTTCTRFFCTRSPTPLRGRGQVMEPSGKELLMSSGMTVVAPTTHPPRRRKLGGSACALQDTKSFDSEGPQKPHPVRSARLGLTPTTSLPGTIVESLADTHLRSEGDISREVSAHALGCPVNEIRIRPGSIGDVRTPRRERVILTGALPGAGVGGGTFGEVIE
jgi:hypothetical protein